MKIAVTGGTGSPDRGIGPVVIAALRAEGHEVTNLDVKAPPIPGRDFRHVDLTHYGDTFAALHGNEAVVHLAANANPDFDHFTGAQRFHTNTLAAYNVFQAAVHQGMKRVVWASSETVLGFPFDKVKPSELPTSDENPPIPTASYGISKAVTEDLARHMARVHGVTFIGLRFSNIHYDVPGHTTGYETMRKAWANPASKMFNLWGYVDSRDIAQAILKSLTAEVSGAEVFTIAAADTIMPQTNAELVAACLPGTRLKPGTGAHDTLISIAKARKMLGYEPQYSWRTILK